MCNVINADQFNRKLGKNIAAIRQSMGMTQQQLADAMTKAGAGCVSLRMVSSWERAESVPSPCALFHISNALKCTICDIYGTAQRKPDVEQAIGIARSLPQEERNVLRHMFLRWKGNLHALVKCIGLYMSLNNEDRAQVAGYCLWMHDKAVHDKRTNKDAPSVDSAYIYRIWRNLSDSDTLI